MCGGHWVCGGGRVKGCTSGTIVSRIKTKTQLGQLLTTVAEKHAEELGSFGKLTPLELVKALEWMSFTNTEHIPCASLAGLMTMGQRPYVQKDAMRLIGLANRNVDVVYEPFLKNSTFLIGERLTYVDIFVAGATLRGFTHLWDAKWRSAHPHFTRWFTTVVNQPEFVKLFGETQLCDKFSPPKEQ